MSFFSGVEIQLAGGAIMSKVNPRKAQKSQLYPTEAERYAAKLLAKAETIVASANKIWGMILSPYSRWMLTSHVYPEREAQVELEE